MFSNHICVFMCRAHYSLMENVTNAKKGMVKIMKTNNMKSLMHDIKNTLYILKLVYLACPKRAVLSVIKYTLGSCRWAIYNVVFLRILVNLLSTNTNKHQVYILLGIFAFVFISLQVFFVYFNKSVIPETDPILTQNISVMLYKKAATMDLAAYEDPEFYELYYRTLSGARNNVISTFNRVSLLIAMTCSSLIIFFTTAIMDIWALLFVVIPIVSIFTIGNIINKLRYKYDMENMSEDRKINYVKRVAYHKEYANELRIHGIFNVLMRDYNSAMDAKTSNTKKHGLRIALFSLINDNLNYIFLTFGVVLYMLMRISIYKTIDIGDFVVTINSVAILANNLISISMQVISFSENNLYIDNYRKFMNQIPKIVSTGKRLVDTNKDLIFTFENVNFSYDGRQTALQNVNFEIRRNQKNAIVGYNGAGKTTLIKLLLRFYDPDKGRILLNGIDIREYDLYSYRSIFGVCFQDYMIFAAPLSENVLMRRNDEKDNQLVEEALAFSGLEEFIEKKDCVMTKEFQIDGLVLSEGQKQRLSIARAYAKDTPVFILDEPTSALDPIAENRLYQKIDELCEGKTVIFITHHLGSCMSADQIIYMANGELMETGTFEELMNNKGHFYQLFLKQKGGYTDEL